MVDKINVDEFDLIIFDMDGVILNIFDAIKQATLDMLEKYNINAKYEDILSEMALLIEKLQAIPIPKIVLNAKELLQVSFIEEETVLKKLQIAAYMYSQFKKYKVDSSIYPGIERIIEYINASKKPIAMLTNNKKNYALESLKKFHLDQYFDQIIGFNEAGKLKPEPDGLLKLIEHYSVKDPQRVLFIGDMVTDCQAADGAKVKVLGIASGLCKYDDLKRENPDYLVNDVAEFGRILGI